MTVTPTGLRTHEPPNVVPPFADVICDCRTLPGQTLEDIADQVARALGEGIDYDLELLEPLVGGTESPIDTPLYAALAEYVAAPCSRGRAAAAALGRVHRLPLGPLGLGHGRLRVRPVLFGDIDAYLSAAHAVDEAVEIDDLVEMADFHLRVLMPDSARLRT